MDSASVDALLGDEAAMSDPAVMGSVMNGLLESLSAQPAPETNKKDSPKVDQSAVSHKRVSLLFTYCFCYEKGQNYFAGGFRCGILLGDFAGGFY